MDRELALAYKNAPKNIRAGRVVMFIGCLLFFFSAFMDMLTFVLTLAFPAETNVNWSDVGEAFTTGALPLLSIFFVFAGIGGICFIRDKGGKMRKFATLAAVVTLVVFVVDTVLAIRGLVRNLMNPSVGGGTAWAQFLLSLVDIQLSGGLYLIGWFMIKDYTGD